MFHLQWRQIDVGTEFEMKKWSSIIHVFSLGQPFGDSRFYCDLSFIIFNCNGSRTFFDYRHFEVMNTFIRVHYTKEMKVMQFIHDIVLFPAEKNILDFVFAV